MNPLNYSISHSPTHHCSPLLTCVRADVLLEVRQLREFPLADLAAIRFDPQVDPRVLRQVTGIGKGFRALRALVRLRLTHVDLRVQLQVRLRREYLERGKWKASIVIWRFYYSSVPPPRNKNADSAPHTRAYLLLFGRVQHPVHGGQGGGRRRVRT